MGSRGRRGDHVNGVVGRNAADRAFAHAGLRRDDVDVLELYDPYSFEIIRQLELEAFGFCGEGEGGPLDEALWSRQRSREVGITDDPDHRYSFAVLDYVIRGLYAELSNIQQLRDEIASGTTRDPARRVGRTKGQIRRRVPR